MHIRKLPPQQVPPWNGGPAKSTRDYMTEEGAHRLAGMIRKAWEKVGVLIHTHVAPVRAANGETLCWTVIMPTLVNGLPVQPISRP